MTRGFKTAFMALLGLGSVFSLGAAPVILSQPKALTVNAGSTASFSVLATNANPVTYQWQYKGTNLLGETNAFLTIENIATNQAGAYGVVVTASDGAVTSAPAKLTVVQGTIVRFALATGNVDVELFDHDKPVTVQNFIHYVKSGVYTNTFFHRLEPGFVLQGGGYGTPNRGSETLVLTNLFDLYALGRSKEWFTYVVNEFGSGPRIRNTFGTLAMARISDSHGVIYTNSANSQWFFNLADNSTNLDNVSGGFTVFGRVIRGADSLSRYNDFSTNSNILNLTNYTSDLGADVFPNLPVLAPTSSMPANSNLVFANISLQTKAVVDLVPPSMKITYPTSMQRLTNGTFTIYGTGRDSTGVAWIDCWMNYYTPTMQYLYPVNVNGLTNWVCNITNAPAGPYYATFRIWDGHGNVKGVNVPFMITTPLTVQTQGFGTISPNLNGKYLDRWAKYSMTAVPKSGYLFAGWTGTGPSVHTPKLSFVMETNMVLTATFVPNYFPNVSGRYDGLFSSTNGVAPESAGEFTITANRTGTFTGKMYLSGDSITLTGSFDPYGNSSLTVKQRGTTNLISIALSLDLTNNTGMITGSVSNANWQAALHGNRGLANLSTNTVPAPGKYVLRLPSNPSVSAQPLGDGYATVVASSTGVLTVSGALADGSAFTESVTVSKDGVWPLFASLNKGKGILYGWGVFGTNLTANLQWIKPGTTNGFTNSFSTQIDATGISYLAPVAKSQYQIVFTDAGAEHGTTNLLDVNSLRQFVVNGKPANTLKIALKANGGVSGQFVVPSEIKPVNYFGGFLNPSDGGFGYYVTPSGRSGHVQIMAK